jgi:outer membrane protein assembly factor BamB
LGEVVVGSFDHNIYCLSPEGKLKWKITTGDRVLGIPAIGGDGTVYVGSDDGRFYAIH